MAYSRVQIEGQISFFGNDRGELREAGDTKVINFNVAVQQRKREGDKWVNGDTLWKRCSAFGRTAENIVESFKKGDLVLITGEERAESYEKNGETVNTSSVRVDSIGHAVRWDTAESHRKPSSGGNNSSGESSSSSSSGSSNSSSSGKKKSTVDFESLDFDDDPF